MTKLLLTPGFNSPPRRVLGFGVVLACAVAGCGGPEMAVVTGNVTAKGKAVKGGTLVFSPLAGATPDSPAGQTATAEIQPDGTYSLFTEKPGDGARVGRYRILFTPPAQELTEEQRTDPKYVAPPPYYMGMHAEPAEVEVKSGPNTLDFQLVLRR